MSFTPSPSRAADLQLSFLKYVINSTELNDRLNEEVDFAAIMNQLSMDANDDGKTLTVTLKYERHFPTPTKAQPAPV